MLHDWYGIYQGQVASKNSQTLLQQQTRGLAERMAGTFLEASYLYHKQPTAEFLIHRG